ncbi:MAG: hypothetical protein GY711_00255 [bacterium]|nr:hypothetical protein [bacterium]
MKNLWTLLVCALFLPACGSTGTTDLGPEDWTDFAAEMVTSMTETGVLERYRESGQPVVIAIGDFRNDSTNPKASREKDFMYNEIREAIVNSGRAQVNMDIAGTGGHVDRLLQEIHHLVDDPRYDPNSREFGGAPIPRLVLHGQFISSERKSGRSTQVLYAASARLIEVQNATTVWEEQVILPTTFTRGILGG